MWNWESHGGIAGDFCGHAGFVGFADQVEGKASAERGRSEWGGGAECCRAGVGPVERQAQAKDIGVTVFGAARWAGLRLATGLAEFL